MATIHQKIAILKSLETPDGHIDPEALVAVAADDDHPLHNDFTWDTEKAAHERRLDQARSLIRSVRLHHPVASMPIPISVPAYVRDLRAETKGYRAILKVRDEETVARTTVLDAMSRASAAIRRAKTLAVVFNAEDLVDQVESLVDEIVERVRITDQPGGEA